MRFFAIVCPPVAVLMARKPFQSLIALGLWICLWIPGSIYAWGVVTDYKADKRMKKQVKYQRKLDTKDYQRQQKEIEKEDREEMKKEGIL